MMEECIGMSVCVPVRVIARSTLRVCAQERLDVRDVRVELILFVVRTTKLMIICVS